MRKFTYAGHHGSTFTVQLNGRGWTLTIEPFDDTFEVWSEGGSLGHFTTFGKAVIAAERHLITMDKNNPL